MVPSNRSTSRALPFVCVWRDSPCTLCLSVDTRTKLANLNPITLHSLARWGLHYVPNRSNPASILCYATPFSNVIPGVAQSIGGEGSWGRMDVLGRPQSQSRYNARANRGFNLPP